MMLADAIDTDSSSASDSNCCSKLLSKANRPQPWASNRNGVHVIDDAHMAKEMYELSVSEREKVFDDIHGVATTLEETPELLLESIRTLDKAIANSRHRNLTRAMFLRPELETDTKFKLLFLRSTGFDVKAAMKRMCAHFDKKIEIFGEDKIVKDITISDLSEKDLEYHKTLVVLPKKDSAGRSVVLYVPTHVDWKTLEVTSLLRFYWYIIMTALDETTQKKGVCGVEYAPGLGLLGPGLNGSFVELSNQAQAVEDCLPVRITGVHIGYDDARIHFVVETVRLATTKFSRLRLRTHFGSPVEIEYALLSFGVQCQNLIEIANKGDDDMLPDDIDVRQKREQLAADNESKQEEASGIVLYPKTNDILIGRGQPFREYPANLVWYKFIDAHVERFVNSTDKFTKTCISMDVVKTARDSNFRFLQRTAVGWTILDDLAAREKAAIFLRSRARAVASESGASATSNGSGGGSKKVVRT